MSKKDCGCGGKPTEPNVSEPTLDSIKDDKNKSESVIVPTVNLKRFNVPVKNKITIKTNVHVTPKVTSSTQVAPKVNHKVPPKIIPKNKPTAQVVPEDYGGNNQCKYEKSIEKLLDCDSSSESSESSEEIDADEICQVKSRLVDALQVPSSTAYPDSVKTWADGTTFDNMGLLSQIETFLNADGSRLYGVYLNLPNVPDVTEGQLFSNNDGHLTSLDRIVPDNFSLGGVSGVRPFGPNSQPSSGLGQVDTGGVSPDFTYFTVIDDDTEGTYPVPQTQGNLRIRLYTVVNDAFVFVGSVLFTDFAPASGSANGGSLTGDNKYVVFNYISPVNGPVVKAVPVSVFQGASDPNAPAIDPVVPTISIPGFSNGPNIVTVGKSSYIIVSYTNIVSFQELNIQPPFGFTVIKLKNNILTELLSSSQQPQFASTPNTSSVLVESSHRKLIRIAAGTGRFSPVGSVRPQVPALYTPPTVPPGADPNDLQIFDFDIKSSQLTKRFSGDVEASIIPTWIPKSNGTMLVVSCHITAGLATINGDPASPPDYTAVRPANIGSTVIYNIIPQLKEHKVGKKWKEIGKVHIQGNAAVGVSVSKNSKWFSSGADPLTPIGTSLIPSFGFPTVAGTVGTNGQEFQPPPYPANPVGFNTLLLYRMNLGSF